MIIIQSTDTPTGARNYFIDFNSIYLWIPWYPYLIEFHKRDIDVNNEIELNLLLELLLWKALRESISSAILSLKPHFDFLVIRSESNNFRIMISNEDLPIITVATVKNTFWIWLFSRSISPKRSHRSQIVSFSHTFQICKFWSVSNKKILMGT